MIWVAVTVFGVVAVGALLVAYVEGWFDTVAGEEDDEYFGWWDR